MKNYHLQSLTSEIQLLRTRQRHQCRQLLSAVWPWADAMAQKFKESEMLVLASTYQRLPWCDLCAIDAGAADAHCTVEEVQGAFSQVLASHLLYLAMVESDDAFLPGEEGTDFAGDLAEKVRVLPAGEAVALQVILECARTVPAAVIVYGAWWHPAMMLRLLISPEFDWPR